MTYEKPSFVEIGMNAEIGAYQADFVEARRELHSKARRATAQERKVEEKRGDD